MHVRRLGMSVKIVELALFIMTLPFSHASIRSRRNVARGRLALWSPALRSAMRRRRTLWRNVTVSNRALRTRMPFPARLPLRRGNDQQNCR
jgi:hypothetical protein